MSQKILYQGKYRRFVCKDGWEFMERVHSDLVVVMLPVTDDRKIVLVEQLRIPIGQKVLELPAGIVHDQPDNQHETLEETARRELIEETGYDASRLTLLMAGPGAASISTDVMYLFYAEGLKKVGEGGGDATENIKVHEIPLKKFENWLTAQQKKGTPIDPKIYMGLYFLRQIIKF